MTGTSLGHELPDGARWAFDASVTDCFDDMLARSIPQYDEMRRLCFAVGSRFVEPDTDVVDLGCSRGAALAPFVERFGGSVRRFIGVEVSAPMRQAAESRFADRRDVAIESTDLRHDYPRDVGACLTLAVLTLQFVPIEYRAALVSRAFNATKSGGAIVVVEKVLGCDAKIDALLVDEYIGHKRRSGYSPKEIAKKRESLEGVLVPLSAHWNEQMLASAGFGHIECFWRWANFAAWVAVKP